MIKGHYFKMAMKIFMLSLCVPVLEAHEGSATFTVLSMAPGSWICNAQVSTGGDTMNSKNAVSGVISGPWSNNLTTIRNDGEFLNLNESGNGLLRNSINSLKFILRSPIYNAVYTVDLCTSDPGDEAGEIRGPEISNFKTWVSVTNLTSGDTGGIDFDEAYLNRSQVRYSSMVACGASLVYRPSTLYFADSSPVFAVPPTPIVSDIPVLQDGSWNGTMGATGKRSPYCVTRFIFTETSGGERSRILEGGVFNIAVTQSQ